MGKKDRKSASFARNSQFSAGLEYRLQNQGIVCTIYTSERIFLFSKTSDQLWGPHSSPHKMDTRGPLLGKVASEGNDHRTPSRAKVTRE
jgi:hypothetical protein